MSLPKHTFFCENLDQGALSEEETHHAAKVLRLKEGDAIFLLNGKGKRCVAKITFIDKKQVQFEITEEVKNNSKAVDLHIVIAPTKSMDRFAFFLEKVTEMGCAEITPVYTTNSERKNLRTDKAKKTIIGALKQSGNLYLPQLNEPITLKEFFEQKIDSDVKMIAHCEEDGEKRAMKDSLEKGTSAMILIGPEGDFSPEEVILAKENGFFPVSLGEARFRTETAGVLACHTAYLQL